MLLDSDSESDSHLNSDSNSGTDELMSLGKSIMK